MARASVPRVWSAVLKRGAKLWERAEWLGDVLPASPGPLCCRLARLQPTNHLTLSLPVYKAWGPPTPAVSCCTRPHAGRPQSLPALQPPSVPTLGAWRGRKARVRVLPLPVSRSVGLAKVFMRRMKIMIYPSPQFGERVGGAKLKVRAFGFCSSSPPGSHPISLPCGLSLFHAPYLLALVRVARGSTSRCHGRQAARKVGEVD